ncbi:MAG: HAD family phosphatase [Clostridiales bacterium]|nr:HAD family phosphatase [Clostridiales bacterium]
MNTYDIRLIVMDMDGTLLSSQQSISAENMKALALAQQQGIKIALCTGRLPGDASLYAVQAGLPEIAILSLNGSYCLHKPHGQAYTNHVLDDKALETCVKILIAEKSEFACYAQNSFIEYADEDDTDKVSVLAGMKKNCEGAPKYYMGMEEINRFRNSGINKISCYERDRERLPYLCRALEGVLGIEVTSSWAQSIEIMPKGINKGLAVRELAETLGLARENVMTFGDYDNDVTMIDYAGLGVAMSNATDSVKAVADYVTLSNDEDGVADAIRRFALK